LYQLGFHNADVDYHICTGKQPKDNIMDSFLKMKKIMKTDDSPPTFNSMISTDLMNNFTRTLLIILALIGIQTWIYSKRDFFKTIRSRIRQKEISPIQKVDNMEGAKNVILGASGTLAIIAVIILLNAPATKVRSIAKIDPGMMNHGSGRLWNYASRFSLPILNYFLLPIIIIGSNSKMRKTLKREIKDFIDNLC